MNEQLIVAQDVKKSFNDGHLSVNVLKGVELTVKKQQSVSIIGASGSGKSTLLHLLGGLDDPDSGDIVINNQSVNKETVDRSKQVSMRNETLNQGNPRTSIAPGKDFTKGFSVTLGIGILTTLFTAYFFARHLSSFYVMRNKDKKITI